MNPLKCAFGVSAGKFLGFIIHEKSIEIDPKKIEAMRKVETPTCKKDLQKNYLRRFISNLSGKIDAFTPILQLRMKPNLLGGQNSKRHLRKLNIICLRRRFLKHLGEVFLLNFI